MPKKFLKFLKSAENIYFLGSKTPNPEPWVVQWGKNIGISECSWSNRWSEFYLDKAAKKMHKKCQNGSKCHKFEFVHYMTHKSGTVHPIVGKPIWGPKICCAIWDGIFFSFNSENAYCLGSKTPIFQTISHTVGKKYWDIKILNR